MKHRILNLLSVIGLLLAATACTAEVELGEEGGTGGLALRPGEKEFSIRLNGITDVSGVPVTRAAELVTVEGENEIQSITIYGMVGLNVEGKEVMRPDYPQDSPFPIREYTLERVYRYVPGSSGNDILLVADGSGYKLSFGVQSDAYKRAFLVAVNTKEENYNNRYDNVSAPSVAVPVYTDAATPTLSDRTSASTGQDILLLQSGARIESNTMSVTPPLAMGGMAYFTIQSMNGEVMKSYFFTQEFFDRGMSVDLIRSAGRFDVKLPDYTKLLGLSDGTVTYGVKTPFENYIDYPLDPRSYSGVKFASLNTTVASNNVVSGAFYLPAGTINGTVKLKVEYLDKEVDLVVFGSTTINPNTRYIINVTNSGANNLSASLRVAEWNTDEGEIDSGDLYGTLNKGATMGIAVTRMQQDFDTGEFIEVPVTNADQALQYGELSTDTRKITVVYRSRGTVYVKLTGASGDIKPIGIMNSDGWLDWTRKTEVTSSGTDTLKIPVIMDYAVPYFAPPQTSTLKVLTHPDGGKEQCDEYVIEKDWVTPTMAASGTETSFPEMTIIAPNDKWSVDKTTKTITLPALTGYEALMLRCSESASITAGPMSGWITEGLGDWLKTSYIRGKEGIYGGGDATPSHIEIIPADNFKSDRTRTSELVLREYKGTGLEYTTYRIIQPGGNFDASLLSNGGFGVNITPAINGGDIAEGLKYADRNLECPPDGPSMNPASYNISIHSNDSNPVFVEIIQGGSWMSLEKEMGRLDGSTTGKYAVGLRVSNNETAIKRSGKIAVSYRDATTNTLKTEIIIVSQDKKTSGI